jgi:hypothetical protein
MSSGENQKVSKTRLYFYSVVDTDPVKPEPCCKIRIVAVPDPK